MDGFNEQIVKRQTNAKSVAIKIIAVLLLFTLPALCILLALATRVGYLIYAGLFIFIGGIYGVWYVFSCQKVEFEYSVSGNDLEISKVIALRKRKKLCKVPINEIEKLGKGESTVDGMRFSKSFFAAGKAGDEDNYFAVYNSPAYGKCLLEFAPNEKILQGMKSHLNKQIVIKLFYNRSAN